MTEFLVWGCGLIGAEQKFFSRFYYREEGINSFSLKSIYLLPNSNGIALTRMLRRRFKNLKVIVLSICDGEECKNNAEKAGASAYITKGQPLERLKDSILKLAAAS